MRGLIAALMLTTTSASAEISFHDLKGWAGENHGAALSAFRTTCDLVPDLERLCEMPAPDPRAFFEENFRPVLIGTPPALFTAYYEPELPGSTTRTDRFAYPVYVLPPEGPPPIPRADMPSALAGRGLEIAWLDDPADLFFLHVQGSGRIRLPDGQVIRLGYAGKNGLEYRSIGRELVRRGIFTVPQATAEAVKDWIRANPEDGAALMNHNPSFIFFRPLDLPTDAGPIGSMGRPVIANRSIAVDPDHVALGLPVWVEREGAAPRLFVAHDTGSAIKGPQRADIFMGSGPEAGLAASPVADPGRMIVLVPR
ncbi:murein transglycosylase A [Cereibacter sp. SYSU M97828]|nr:murein transglycosylase A [Cereibacter flavus]